MLSRLSHSERDLFSNLRQTGRDRAESCRTGRLTVVVRQTWHGVQRLPQIMKWENQQVFWQSPLERRPLPELRRRRNRPRPMTSSCWRSMSKILSRGHQSQPAAFTGLRPANSSFGTAMTLKRYVALNHLGQINRIVGGERPGSSVFYRAFSVIVGGQP